jgi:hypothetical protein
MTAGLSVLTDHTLVVNTGEGPVTPSLEELLAELHAGAVNGADSADRDRLIGGLRAALLLLPTDGAESVFTAQENGLHWVYAFTGTERLARFAAARGEGEREWPYLTVRGSRLAEVVLPELGPDVALAVNVAGPCPGLFPASVLAQVVLAPGKAA